MGRKVGYGPAPTRAHHRGVGMLDVRRKAALAAAKRWLDHELRTQRSARGSGRAARSAHELVDDRLSLPAPARAPAPAAEPAAAAEIFGRLAPGMWSKDGRLSEGREMSVFARGVCFPSEPYEPADLGPASVSATASVTPRPEPRAYPVPLTVPRGMRAAWSVLYTVSRGVPVCAGPLGSPR